MGVWVSGPSWPGLGLAMLENPVHKNSSQMRGSHGTAGKSPAREHREHADLILQVPMPCHNLHDTGDAVRVPPPGRNTMLCLVHRALALSSSTWICVWQRQYDCLEDEAKRITRVLLHTVASTRAELT